MYMCNSSSSWRKENKQWVVFLTFMPTNHVPNPEQEVFEVTKLPNITTKVSKCSLMLAVLMKIAQEERTRE